jgi:hypothetical protein
MSISSGILRVADYYRRFGLAATMRRGQVALSRSLFASRMVVFYCDLDERKLKKVKFPESLKIHRLVALSELRVDYLERIISVWSPKLAHERIRERFDKGSTLWLIEHDGRLAGYGWTLRGTTIAPYYFPLGPNDVQLFDFYVFHEFRGRALHWFLTAQILNTLAAEGGARAYADTHEWNQAQVASFKMTPFRPLGFVRTYQLFGHYLTCWVAPNRKEEKLKGAPKEDGALNVVRSNQ